MANKEQLLAEAKELGLEIPEGATNNQIQKAIDEKLAEAPKNEEEQETDEEKTAREAKEKAAEEARLAEEKEQEEAIAEQKRLEEEAKKTSDKSQGSDIASAIVEGLKATKEDKRIRIKSDKSVVSRYSIVRNKQTNEVMIRENETGILSKVQLESLEEKEASLQNIDVEEL